MRRRGRYLIEFVKIDGGAIGGVKGVVIKQPNGGQVSGQIGGQIGGQKLNQMSNCLGNI